MSGVGKREKKEKNKETEEERVKGDFNFVLICFYDPLLLLSSKRQSINNKNKYNIYGEKIVNRIN